MQADLMLTTAQIGMALAGFAGLVTLLRHFLAAAFFFMLYGAFPRGDIS